MNFRILSILFTFWSVSALRNYGHGEVSHPKNPKASVSHYFYVSILTSTYLFPPGS
ncbi:hypothetical protein ACHAXS_006479 [Conticribra weissflogii]